MNKLLFPCVVLAGCVAAEVAAASPATPISLPRIPRPAHPNAALAQALARWDRQQASKLAECKRQVAEHNARQRRGDAAEARYELAYKVLLDSAQVYSVRYDIDTDCAGAHPDVERGGVAFETQTGKPYDAAQLYRVGQPAKDGGTALAPDVRERVRDKLFQARATARGVDDCIDVLKQDPIEYADALALGRDGLHVFVSGIHVAQACYGPVVLRYESLRDYLDPAEAARLQWVRK